MNQTAYDAIKSTISAPGEAMIGATEGPKSKGPKLHFVAKHHSVIQTVNIQSLNDAYEASKKLADLLAPDFNELLMRLQASTGALAALRIQADRNENNIDESHYSAELIKLVGLVFMAVQESGLNTQQLVQLLDENFSKSATQIMNDSVNELLKSRGFTHKV